MLQAGSVELEAPAFEPRNDSVRRECRVWALSPNQIETFFKLSTEYEEIPYAQFYQLPCAIRGRLSEGGRAWSFSINAGATAVWTNGSETRVFGCMAAGCEALVLLMPDGMDPD